MNLDISSKFGNLGEKFDKFLSTDPEGRKARPHLSGVDFKVGVSTDPGFGTDIGAATSPVYVGDSHWVGDSIGLEQADAVSKVQGADSVAFRYQVNPSTGKYDKQYVIKGVNDAAPNLVGAQLLSPASAGWVNQAFKQVLAYSHAKELVTTVTGDNPWATVLNFPMIAYGGGFPTINMAGGAGNVDTFDVWTKTDAGVAQVVNMEVTHRLTVEETGRMALGNTYPLAGQAMMQKQAYANWALDFLESVVTYYGNSATGTTGLLNVNAAVSWGGTSLTDIKNGVSTTKGSLAYQAVANAIADFLSTNLNKPNLLRIAMSPLAYNILGSLPYSDAYSSVSALAALVTNFDAGLGPKGSTPRIEIYPDPLLGGSGSGNTFNSNVYDYMVITAPRIAGGVDEEDQPVIFFGKPLDKFVYPTIPGAYATQYKTLKRIAGVYAPYSAAVKTYYGFGIDS